MGNTISLKNKIFYIFILCLAVFIAADDQTVVVTLLPSMVLDLGISVGELNKISWTITSYLLGFTLVMPLAGKLCDKFGYRLVLIFSMIIFSIGSLLIGITVNLPESNYVPSKLNWLIVFRFLQAMGGGAIIPIAIASVSLILEKKYWIYGFGLIGASAEAGGVIGPLWGSLILEIWDWPAAFFINIPLAILIIFLALLMPKSKKNKHQIKFLDISLFSLIIIISTIFISEYDGLDFTQIILLITILALVIITTIKIRLFNQEILPDKLIKSKTFLWSSLTHFFIGSSLIIVMVIIPLSGSTVFGLDSLTIGLSLLKLTAFIGLGSILGIFLTRLSLTLTLILGSILITSGTIIYSNNIETPTNEIDYIFYILGIGFGLFIVPIHNSGLHKISENIRGISSSMISLSRMLGMIFGLSLMTTIGTARFSDLVSGMNILSLDPDIQQKINEDINSAGIEVFNEIMFGAFIFSIITFFTSLILIYYYRRNQ
ncbi:MAG: MFS transporter [SAR202 cluster bacterium]|nr:MFS transporter [Chloroflexota bacterium]MQG24374.1 MFS transporter [SAR202 cluster bacterium]|tara:strand:+ start:1506 stop:2969 length:1464 start_codon:yes stop_codon:yes gene_type:complete